MSRQRWISRRIFLFAAIGSAVGLGNIWRFPYLTYKYGGGAFLIPYLIALFIIGIPIMILELGIGQKLQKGAIATFSKIDKRLAGIGFTSIFAGFIIVTYYSVLIAWVLLFFINSFRKTLPWTADPNGYFFNTILKISDSVANIGGINWPVFFALLATWIIIYYCVRSGVSSLGKVIRIVMPLPIILLIILFIRTITLDGALTGIYYYLKPNFAALLSTEIWLAAASQIFFSLSVGYGIMIAYASYNKKTEDATGDAVITSVSDAVISIFAGFVVFSVIGYMAAALNTGVETVVTSGPGLAFIVFPQALSLMPFAWFFSAIFFLSLLNLGLGSAFSIVEGVVTVIQDKTKRFNQHQIAIAVCVVAFLIGILFTTGAGLYFLDIIDHFIANFAIILVGLFECLAIGWIYGAAKLRRYVNKVSKWKIGIWWDILIKYIIPLILLILLIIQFINELKGNYEGYPTWALAIGWAVVIIPIIISIWLALRPKSSNHSN